jgi:hypothetical protein
LSLVVALIAFFGLRAQVILTADDTGADVLLYMDLTPDTSLGVLILILIRLSLCQAIGHVT